MSENALIVTEKLNTEILFTEKGELEKVMIMIRGKLDEFEPDLETDKGRKKIASMARKVSSSKAFLDKLRKAQNAKAKAEIDGRNAMWNPVRDELDELRDSTRKPLTDWEAAEKEKEEKRIESVKKKFQYLEGLTVNYVEHNVEQIQQVIDMLEGVKIEPEEYFEFTQVANETVTERLAWACDHLEKRKDLDRQEAERKAEDERLEKERKEQERIAAEQAEAQRKIDEANRKIEAEKKALDAEKRAEQERKEREELEKKMAEEARIQAEKDAKEKAEREAREAAEAKERERLEAERQERLKPDKQKMLEYAEYLDNEVYHKIPVVESDEAQEISRYTAMDLAQTSDRIRNSVESM